MATKRTQKVVRDSRTGRFLTTSAAKRRPSTTQTETVRIPKPKRKRR